MRQRSIAVLEKYGTVFSRTVAVYNALLLLRQAREKAGLTQEQVAERLSTKKSATSRIENSAGSIRFSTPRALCESHRLASVPGPPAAPKESASPRK